MSNETSWECTSCGRFVSKGEIGSHSLCFFDSNMLSDDPLEWDTYLYCVDCDRRAEMKYQQSSFNAGHPRG